MKVTTNSKLLIVDDDTATRILISEILEELSLTILESSSAKEGLLLFKNHLEEIVLVLLDIHMPGKDGFYILEEIRALKPNLPVIAISALAPSIIAPKLTNAGFDAHIPKPFDIDEFLRIVKSFLCI